MLSLAELDLHCSIAWLARVSQQELCMYVNVKVTVHRLFLDHFFSRSLVKKHNRRKDYGSKVLQRGTGLENLALNLERKSLYWKNGSSKKFTLP